MQFSKKKIVLFYIKNHLLSDSNFHQSISTLLFSGLVQKYRLNDDTSNKDCINFASIKSGASLPVLFKLLCICTLKKSGSLEDINALLGFGIFMPEDFDMPEPTTADLMIHCINWFR